MKNKNEIQISDIIYQLQKINYAELLDALSPIIIAYIGNRIVSKGIDNYKLYKDYKPKNISLVVLPPELKKKTSELDKERLLSKQLGDSVLHFANTVMDKMPHVDLTLFHNNLENLAVTVKSLKFKNLILSTNTAASYDVKKNLIIVRNGDYLETINHELFHMSTSLFRESDGIRFCGFCQLYLKKFKKIGVGINEGYTQFLTERYFEEENSNIKGAYPLEVKLAEALEQIVGKEKMESLFFKADLYGLIQELKQYDSEENIMKFISGVDFLHNHFYDKRSLPLEKGMIVNSLRSVSNFLIRTYSKKLKQELESGLINTELFYTKLATYISILGRSIIGRSGRKRIRYDFLNFKDIGNILNETLNSPVAGPLVELEIDLMKKGK